MCHGLRRNLGKAQCLAIQDPYPNGKPAVAQAKAAAPQERFIARFTLGAESPPILRAVPSPTRKQTVS